MHTLFTAGYEGMVQPDFIAGLQRAGILRVIDVRAVPQSRKPGFSKRLLAATLAQAGIAYTHLRALGTPKPGRIAARAGDAAGMERVFLDHLAGDAPMAALAEATALAAEAPSCLICFEHDPALCHRRLLADRIHAATGQPVTHLEF
jgi:uncharacterized protein (DUF488 family)